MDRRTAMMFTMTALLASCGGGGGSGGTGGSATAGLPGLQPTAPPASALSPNIVAWGDSMTPAFALNLQVLYPNRIVVNEGFLGQTSAVIAANQLADTTHLDWINIFWYGHNDITEDLGTAAQAIEANIAASIAHLVPGNTHFIVLSVVNNAVRAPKGTAEYQAVLRINADLAARYPDNYLDVRSWLVSHYDPNNPQDVIDFANDVPPSSLRYDDIHLRNEGSVLVAQRVKQFIDAKGW